MKSWAKNPATIALALFFIGFFLVSIFYIDHRLIGDQLGLWGYISNHENQHPFALWNFNAAAGAPQSLNPEYSYLDASYFISILVGDMATRSALINSFHLLLFGIGVLLLAYHITKRLDASVIAASVAAFSSGAAIRTIGNNPYYFGMAIMPFILYSLILLLEKPSYSRAFFVAFTWTYLIVAGGTGVFLWMIFFMPFFLLIYFFLHFDKAKIPRQAIFLVMAFVMFMLFSLFKIWGSFQYASDTSLRPTVQPYQFFLQGNGLPPGFLNSLASIVIRLPVSDYVGLWIGPLTLILLLFSLKSIKKKQYLLFLGMFVIAVLVVFNTPITHLAHLVPFLNRTKDVVKSLFLFPILAGIIAGFGFIELKDLLKKYSKTLSNYLPIMLVALLIVQFLAAFVFYSEGMLFDQGYKINEKLSQESILKDLQSNQPFRLSYEDFSGGLIQVRIAKQGYEVADWLHGNGFSAPFLTFKNIASQTRNYEMLGLMNVKYIYNTKPLNSTFLKLIRSNGQEFVFEDTAFLPRHMKVPYAILAYEDEKNPTAAYSLMANPIFNFSTTIVMSTGDISGVELNKFDAIILTKNPSQNDAVQLSSYEQSGGLIFTSEINEKYNVSLQSFISGLNGKYEPILTQERGGDSLSVDVKKGWIFLSETFPVYQGWSAKLNGKPVKIFRADGIFTALYAAEDGKLEFEYKPTSFSIGLLISGLAFAISAGLLLYINKNKLAKFAYK